MNLIDYVEDGSVFYDKFDKEIHGEIDVLNIRLSPMSLSRYGVKTTCSHLFELEIDFRDMYETYYSFPIDETLFKDAIKNYSPQKIINDFFELNENICDMDRVIKGSYIYFGNNNKIVKY